MTVYHLLLMLYPYPYQIFALFITLLIVAAVGFPFYGIYRLIIQKMSKKGKELFSRVLKIAGISLIVIFLTEMTITLITQQHVNRQLGFGYATPETPEGEFFIISRVVPDGIMAQSGLKPEDRVLLDGPVDLYRLLINSQGRDIEFNVLRDEEKITIMVSVPEMELPLGRVVFWF